jgi:hypothetical protein
MTEIEQILQAKRLEFRNNVDCVIVRMKFGSHLYGTSTPDSDTDYKGVFMPKWRDLVLHQVKPSRSFGTKKIQETKNTKHDIDEEYFSLKKFVEIACVGDTNALDMLHAPMNRLLTNSWIWMELVKNRKRFYTRNLKAFVEYARKQAAKYGVKGSRLAIVKQVLQILEEQGDKVGWKTKIREIWDLLPKDCEHVAILKDQSLPHIKQYQVCGRAYQETVSIEYLHKGLTRHYEEYGHRAILAEKNEGIDWKAVSHALRAAFQLEELFTYNMMTLPLPQADFLREVKQGKHNYKDHISPLLDEKISNVEKLAAKSQFPEEPDRTWWENWLYEITLEHFNLRIKRTKHWFFEKD